MSTEVLRGIILTLENIEVRGQKNLQALLGCITILQRELAQMTQEGDDGRQANK